MQQEETMFGEFGGGSADRLKVLHCLRAPVGGLFRHVCDLARAQCEAGYEVGVVCSDEPNDATTLDKLSRLETFCTLGVKRVPLGRFPGVSDIRALRATKSIVQDLQPDIVHGHGAKGGLLSRLVNSRRPIARVYTPHGGSVHYFPSSLAGIVFGTAERLMMTRTDGLVFESSFARDIFAERFGVLPANATVVHNGLSPEEFENVSADSSAADFVFLGELRALKGVFTLIDAIAFLKNKTSVSLAVVGEGPEKLALMEKVEALNLSAQIRFLGEMPARAAFTHGRVVVMPSHHDSFPYVALEAIAAGKPLLATRTGGIPEIFGPFSDVLVAPADAEALATAMLAQQNDRPGALKVARELRGRVRDLFSVEEMAKGVASVYKLAAFKKFGPTALKTPAVGIRVNMDVAE